MRNTINLLLTVSFIFSGSALAAPMYFDYTAYIDSSDRPGAPTGTLLTGTFSYDPAATGQIGDNHYYPDSGTAFLSAKGVNGFSLTRETRAINVTPGAESDTMTMQSFISEEPNGWNMVFDFIEPGGPSGWLQGDSSLPTAFPSPPDNGFISLYFTDEGDWTRTVDATILTVTTSAIPVPAAVWLFGSALTGLAWVRRKKTA
jgi:hypothetical protein